MKLPSRKHFAATLATLTIAVFGFAWSEAGAKDKESAESVQAITSAFHITAEDGIKSIAQLIAEQNPSEVIPDQAIKSFHFYVSPFQGDLKFPRVEGFQPLGFEWGVRSGDNVRLEVPEIEITAPIGLQFFLLQAVGPETNVLIVTEFYPKPKK